MQEGELKPDPDQTVAIVELERLYCGSVGKHLRICDNKRHNQ